VKDCEMAYFNTDTKQLLVALKPKAAMSEIESKKSQRFRKEKIDDS